MQACDARSQSELRPFNSTPVLGFFTSQTDKQFLSPYFVTVKFADDTNLLISSSDFNNLIQTLNVELEKVNDFFKAYQLKNKNGVLQRLRLAMHSFNQMVQHQNLKTVPPFLVYRQIVANTISQNNSMINRVKNRPPPSTLKILYYSFI